MKITRKIINIDESLWDGCGVRIPSCHEQAIQLAARNWTMPARICKN